MKVWSIVLSIVVSGRLHFHAACQQAKVRSVDVLTPALARITEALSKREKSLYSVYTSTLLLKPYAKRRFVLVDIVDSVNTSYGVAHA